MKEYVKPELEVISLVADEPITDDLGIGGYGSTELAPGDW